MTTSIHTQHSLLHSHEKRSVADHISIPYPAFAATHAREAFKWYSSSHINALPSIRYYTRKRDVQTVAMLAAVYLMAFDTAPITRETRQKLSMTGKMEVYDGRLCIDIFWGNYCILFFDVVSELACAIVPGAWLVIGLCYIHPNPLGLFGAGHR